MFETNEYEKKTLQIGKETGTIEMSYQCKNHQ